MKVKLHIWEALVVLVFLCIACWTAHIFFGDMHNSNDLRTIRMRGMKKISNNRLILTGYLWNYSDIPLRNISVIADAYDVNKRLIGTGTYVPAPGVSISPADTLGFSVEVTVPAGCSAVRNFMVIPRSSLGTGKPTFASR